jgi:CelD/BcsL family acetyltransferase involved in cellulose biosynthesis
MPLQPSPFLETIIHFLMPFFLGTSVDRDAARGEILDTLASYAARTRSELLNAAQIIAFGMSTLDTLAEAKATVMSTSMRLRFRSCANGLNRACKQNETTLDQRLACDLPPVPEPIPDPINDLSDLQALDIVQQAQQKIDTSRDRLAASHPVANAHPVANPKPVASARPITNPKTDRNKQLWGAAMMDVLNQMGMPVDPVPDPAQQRP